MIDTSNDCLFIDSNNKAYTCTYNHTSMLITYLRPQDGHDQNCDEALSILA